MTPTFKELAERKQKSLAFFGHNLDVVSLSFKVYKVFLCA